MSPKLEVCRIVMVFNCPDPGNHKRSDRRFLVIETYPRAGTVDAVGLSRDTFAIETGADRRWHIEIASGTPKHPHPVTKLREQTYAICDDWFWTLDISAIDVVEKGFCDFAEGFDNVMEALERLHREPSRHYRRGD